MMKAISGRRGFTLVELMITLVIFGLVLGIIYGVFISSRKVLTTEEQLVGLAQEARGGLAQMVRELRMAGAMTAGVVTPCSALIVATTTEVEFEGDVDLDRTTVALERVRYFLDASTKTLNRWEYKVMDDTIGTWNEGPLLGPPPTPGRCAKSIASEPSLTITKEAVAYNIDALIINTIDSGGKLTANLANVTKVSLTIKAKSESPDERTKTLTVEVKLPNLGIEKAGVDSTAPAKPTGVTAVNREVCGYLGVTWNANSENDLAGYVIYYKAQVINAGVPMWRDEWSPSKTVGLATSTEFNPGPANNGVLHRAAVQAFDTSGNLSVLSDASEVTLNDTRNPTIAGLSAVTNDTTSGITLTWNAATDTDRDGRTQDSLANKYNVNYYIFRDTTAGGPFTTQLAGPYSPITNTTYVTIAPERCVTYFYRVRADDACNRQTLSAVYGLSRTVKTATPTAGTRVVEDVVGKPNSFYPGGGTVHTVQGANTYAYARFSGVSNSSALANAISITSNDAKNSCPAAPALSAGQPGGTAMTTYLLDPPGYIVTPVPMNPGQTFTGRWPNVAQTDGILKGNWYRFAAFTRNTCGFWSEPFDPGYCVDKCTDSTTPAFVGSGGLGDACVINYSGDPIKSLVCDRIKLFWITKDAGIPPAACTAYGGPSNPSGDFYPDQGDGGYLIHRAKETDDTRGNGELYHVLAPDPVTGPIQPFFYQDGFYDGVMNDCERVAATNETFYRDRCSYRYKIKAVDCALNQSAAEAVQLGIRFSPGMVSAPNPGDYPVSVEGAKKNIVNFTVQNTAAAKLTLYKMSLDWVDTTAKLTKVEISNSVESSAAWSTMWSSQTTSLGVTNASTIDFSNSSYTAHDGSGRTATTVNTRSLGASPVLNPADPALDNTYKARIRLTFRDTSGNARRMDDGNETIMVIPYYVNESSTEGAFAMDKMCPPSGDTAALNRAKFYVTPTPPPSVGTVRQNPPTTTTGCSGNYPSEGECSSSTAATTPPSGAYRTDKYGISSSETVPVRTSVTPYSPAYPVAQTGDLATYRGVILYYTSTSNAVTTPPLPQDASGIEELLRPVNYTKLVMTNESAASACSIGTCRYVTVAPIPAIAGMRVWFYIAAIDSVGNYNITPVQTTDAFGTSYSYDTCQYNTVTSGFETGTFAGGGWSVTYAGSFPVVVSNVVASGSYAAHMGDGGPGLGGGMTASIYRSVDLTSCGTKNPKLNLKYKVDNVDDVGAEPCRSNLKVYINNIEVMSKCKDTPAGWQSFTYDLSAFKGTVITLRISSYTSDNLYIVNYYVDDIEIVYE
ncbi:MAG: prepilin-type N-terminal cleavage/methylation domain-containing protein [Thermodesulfovibrionales bacterium]|nr:prepilin-type N-terminal cleavage/methylation domain-containing protein [Thermodesulfovibrionales bacterium]